jgi:hypothetical protein
MSVNNVLYNQVMSALATLFTDVAMYLHYITDVATLYHFFYYHHTIHC